MTEQVYLLPRTCDPATIVSSRFRTSAACAAVARGEQPEAWHLLIPRRVARVQAGDPQTPASGAFVTGLRMARSSCAEALGPAFTAASDGAKARAAGLNQSVIFLLGAGGVDRSVGHATASACLATAMDPEYLSALTLMLIPGTPIQRLTERGQFELPRVDALLRELRILVVESNPSDAIFRSNHASNYLPIGGRLPRDRDAILQQIDAALSGEVSCRAEWIRGL